MSAPVQVLPEQKTGAPQVAIENLVKKYGSLRAIDGLSFVVHSGEWVALMGPSGSGKTTLINILGGLEPCSSAARYPAHTSAPGQYSRGK